MSEDLVGRRFGNYVVEKLLGAGGMGAVYRAVQPDIGKKVAIKFLAEHLTQSPSLVQRFFAEGRAVNLIQHENIVDIFDFGRSEEGLVYCVMEMLSGVSLEDELKERGVPSVPRTLAIVAQLADALAAAHARNILHRDIKPDNVFLIRRKGNDDFVKVLDFGIAKLGDLGDGSIQRTATGTIMGTPGYMSPEQGTAGEVDARTDIYATGALLYRMLTGQLPFEGRSFGEILQKQLTELPAPLRSLRSDVPEPIERLVHAMLMVDPAHRPESMAEVHRALSDPTAHVLELPEPQIAARSPQLMQVVARPLTTLSGAAGQVTAPPPETATVPAPPRRGGLALGLGVGLALAGLGVAGFVATRKPPAVTSAPAGPRPSDEPKPAPPPVPPPVQPAPSGKLTVAIASEPPGAEILDGALVLGRTPASVELDGERPLELVRAGYQKETIEARRDRPTVTVRLTALAGSPRPHRAAASPRPTAPGAPASPPTKTAAEPEPKRHGDVVKEVPF